MKIRSNILVFILTLSVICFVGCKRKTEPAKADPPKGEVSLKAEGKSAVGAGLVPAQNDNIVQPMKVEINTLEPNVTAKAKPKELVATVNGVGILKSDYEARVEQQIGPVQKQMPANFFEQYQKELSKKVLDEMVVDILISQKAKQKGC